MTEETQRLIIMMGLIAYLMVMYLMFNPVNAQPVLFIVYSDQSCTKTAASLDWGTMKPGETVYKTVYIKNISNQPLTNIETIAHNFNSADAQKYLRLDQSPGLLPIQPNKIMPLTLSLTVDKECKGVSNFNFEVLVTMTQPEATPTPSPSPNPPNPSITPSPSPTPTTTPNGGGGGGGSQTTPIPSSPPSDQHSSFNLSTIIGLVIVGLVAYMILGGDKR